MRSQMELERASHWAHWRELGEYILPRRPRFFVQDTDRGNRRNHRIINNTGSVAMRTLSSGMMSGITSPSRPWFMISVSNPDLAERAAVKAWCYEVTKRMQTVIGLSNIYQSLATLYYDVGCFATGAMMLEEDLEHVVHATTLPIGSYMLANDAKQRVRVMVRNYQWTVREIVEKYGMDPLDPEAPIDWTNISDRVKTAWENERYETWVELIHVIMPNSQYDNTKIESKYKKFRSVVYERGYIQGSNDMYLQAADDNRFLSDKGYDYFPVLCPRWDVSSEDIYGTDSPGMLMLGDVRQLQTFERRISQAHELSINPPLKAPPSMKNARVSMLPGEVSYVEEREGSKGMSPLIEVDPNFAEVRQERMSIEKRIKTAAFEDLFLMLANDEREQPPTATEIAERKQEKLIGLGPVLERLNVDLLDPLIHIVFTMMHRQGLIPPPPPELRGVLLEVEYTSIMAEAQKAIGVESLERFSQFVGAIAAYNQQILDKVDMDELIDKYGEAISIPPEVILPQDQVNLKRLQRQKLAQAQQTAEAAQSATAAAKNLSQADTSGGNALSDLLDQAKAGQLVSQN